MDGLRKATIPAISWKIILILTILFVGLLILFQRDIIQKIVEAIKPIIITIPW